MHWRRIVAHSATATFTNARRPSFKPPTRLDGLSVFAFSMGRLLDKLLEGSHAYRIERAVDAYTLVAEPAFVDEFSVLVSEAAAKAGEDCLVFPVCEGGHVYSAMLVVPLDGAANSG